MFRKWCIYYLVVLCPIIASLVACNSPKTVQFPNKIDTTDKPISFQEKKTFSIDELGIYASNEFNGARLNGIEMVNDSTLMVKIFPENAPINNSPYYAFKLWSKNPKDYNITFDYPRGFKHRYWPKVRRGNSWKAVDSSKVYLTDSLVTLNLELNSSPILVAAQKVVGSEDVRNWFNKLVEDKANQVRLKDYGESSLGRRMSVMEMGIGSSKKKDVLILLTRQHPPETTGYFAFQNFVETILNQSDLSNKFLKNYTVLAFPLLNPDGVDLGHWRHNAGGIDLNRDWSEYNQPEIKQTVKFIESFLKKKKSKILLGLDFHSTWHDVYYTNELREGTTLPNFVDQWFAALESNIPDYKVNEASSNSNRPVSKGWFLYGHNAVGITFEIGDNTPIKDIELIGRVSAEQMMKILLNKTN